LKKIGKRLPDGGIGLAGSIEIELMSWVFQQKIFQVSWILQDA
jgi:hypothetical protein